MVIEQRGATPNGATAARGVQSGNGRRPVTRDYRRLINECTEKLLSDPTHKLAIRLRAQSYRMLGEDDAALADYNSLLQLESFDVDALFYRGTILERQQHLDDAIQCYTAVLEQEPHHHKALYNRAVCFSAKGSFSQAIEDFSAALELDQQATKGARRLPSQDQLQQHLDKSLGAAADDAAAALLHGYPSQPPETQAVRNHPTTSSSTPPPNDGLSNTTSISDVSAGGWEYRHTSTTSLWSTTPQSTGSDVPGSFIETESGGATHVLAGSSAAPTARSKSPQLIPAHLNIARVSTQIRGGDATVAPHRLATTKPSSTTQQQAPVEATAAAAVQQQYNRLQQQHLQEYDSQPENPQQQHVFQQQGNLGLGVSSGVSNGNARRRRSLSGSSAMTAGRGAAGGRSVGGLPPGPSIHGSLGTWLGTSATQQPRLVSPSLDAAAGRDEGVRPDDGDGGGMGPREVLLAALRIPAPLAQLQGSVLLQQQQQDDEDVLARLQDLFLAAQQHEGFQEQQPQQQDPYGSNASDQQYETQHSDYHDINGPGNISNNEDARLRHLHAGNGNNGGGNSRQAGPPPQRQQGVMSGVQQQNQQRPGSGGPGAAVADSKVGWSAPRDSGPSIRSQAQQNGQQQQERGRARSAIRGRLQPATDHDSQRSAPSQAGEYTSRAHSASQQGGPVQAPPPQLRHPSRPRSASDSPFAAAQQQQPAPLRAGAGAGGGANSVRTLNGQGGGAVQSQQQQGRTGLGSAQPRAVSSSRNMRGGGGGGMATPPNAMSSGGGRAVGCSGTELLREMRSPSPFERVFTQEPAARGGPTAAAVVTVSKRAGADGGAGGAGVSPLRGGRREAIETATTAATTAGSIQTATSTPPPQLSSQISQPSAATTAGSQQRLSPAIAASLSWSGSAGGAAERAGPAPYDVARMPGETMPSSGGAGTPVWLLQQGPRDSSASGGISGGADMAPGGSGRSEGPHHNNPGWGVAAQQAGREGTNTGMYEQQRATPLPAPYHHQQQVMYPVGDSYAQLSPGCSIGGGDVVGGEGGCGQLCGGDDGDGGHGALDPWGMGGGGGMAAAVEMSRPSTSSSVASDATDHSSRHKALEQYNIRAFAFRQQGKLEEAIREYGRALELDPRHFKTLFNRGFTYDRMGDLAGAVADYSAALAVEPSSSYAHYNRGITRDRLQDFAGAVEDFTAAIVLEPSNADFYHNRGFALRKQGMFEAAIQDYTAAIALNPRHCRAYYNRAFCHDRLNHIQQAIDDYSRALEMEPNNPTALHNRGSLHERNGGPDLALEDYSRAIATDPFCAQSYSARGLLLQSLGRLGEALADLDAAVARSRPHPSAALYRNRAQARRERGDHHGAVQDLTRALSVDPHDLLSYSRRAHCFRRLGEYESAIRDYTRAIALSPNNPKLHTIRAYCYAMIGWYGEAVADYDVVLSLEPGNAHASYNRSIALEKLGGAIDRAAAEMSAVAGGGGGMTAGTAVGPATETAAPGDRIRQLTAATAPSHGPRGPGSGHTRSHSQEALGEGMYDYDYAPGAVLPQGGQKVSPGVGLPRQAWASMEVRPTAQYGSTAQQATAATRMSGGAAVYGSVIAAATMAKEGAPGVVPDRGPSPLRGGETYRGPSPLRGLGAAAGAAGGVAPAVRSSVALGSSSGAGGVSSSQRTPYSNTSFPGDGGGGGGQGPYPQRQKPSRPSWQSAGGGGESGGGGGAGAGGFGSVGGGMPGRSRTPHRVVAVP